MSFRAQLLRVALSLGSRAGSSVGAAALIELGAARNAAAVVAVQQAGGMQRGLAALMTQLQRGFHTAGLPRAAAAAAEPGAAAINPLQQAPAPAAARSPLSAERGAGLEAEAPLRAKAVLRGIAISPRKLNMFAKVVRGLSLEDALIQCEVSCKKSAAILRNVLRSAKANAVNNHGLDADKLAVAEAYVGSGAHLKRTSLHGRGRSGVRLRYRAHLTVVLAEVEGLKRRTRVLPMLPERWGAIQQRKLRGKTL